MATVIDSPELIENQVREDHVEINNCYHQYKATGDMKWYNQFVYDLCRHAIAEELVLYPLLEGLGPSGKKLADESRQYHHQLKEALSKLESVTKDPKEIFDAQFDNAFAVLQEHMTMEENEDLKLISNLASYEDRLSHGKKFNNRKKIVPTRPHPKVPETPIMLNEAMGLMAAPIDKFRDLFRDYPSEQQKI